MGERRMGEKRMGEWAKSERMNGEGISQSIEIQDKVEELEQFGNKGVHFY